MDVVGGLPKRLGAGEVERHGKTETYDDPRFSLHEMVLNPVLRGQEASIINFQLQFFFQIVSGFGPTPFRWILRIFCMFLLLVERWLPTKMFHRLGFTSMTALTCILK